MRFFSPWSGSYSKFFGGTVECLYTLYGFADRLMNFYYDPLDKKCKSVTGAVARGKEVTFRVRTEEAGECYIDLNRDGTAAKAYPMQRTADGYALTLRINETGLYFYRFILNGIYIGRGSGRRADAASGAAYQLTVYDENFTTPDWFKGGVMYQIFPDRFAKDGDYPVGEGKILRRDWGGMPEFRPNEAGIVKNNDFFGGNFRGVLSKLDYLQSLHVTVIYFNPIFESVSNHRYDTGNYKKIDPLLGAEEDFEALVAAAKERGIRVILDGVFNHTGDDSLYFNRYGHYDSVGAYQSYDSPYRDWYDFFDYPRGYQSWWGIETLPAVNEASEGYQNFIFGDDGVLKYWLRKGIGGYRLDVADELPDFFLKKLRKAVKEETPEAVIIGEVWESASDKIAYGKRREYFQGEELDSVMNYPLKDAIIGYVISGKVKILTETIDMLLDNYPKSSLDCLMNILSTHDTARILTVLAGKDTYDKEEMAVTFLSDDERKAGIEKVKLAAVLQYMLPGVPCVYYGDENGMEGYIDPFCRRCFDWEHMNEDLIDFYRKLGAVRAEFREILRDGEYAEVYRGKSSFLLFARVKNGKSCYTYVNNGSEKLTICLKNHAVFQELLTGKEYRDRMEVLPFSYGIFIQK